MRILPIFIPHLGCSFDCIYCDQDKITKSDILTDHKIEEMIADFYHNNKMIKKQIAFFGGTFTNLEQNEQERYFNIVKPYLDDLTSIRISTRPDAINGSKLEFCKKNGVSTIELGIQSFSNLVLQKSGRGYTFDTAMHSCNLVQRFNIELGIQLMPGLPGFSKKSLEKTIKITKKINPNFIRIYPTIVLKGTKLENLYNSNSYKPLNLDKAIEVAVRIIKEIDDIEIAKLGLHSDIEPTNIIAGPYHPSFGEMVRAEILLQNIVENYQNKTLMISKYDVSLFKGFNAKMLTNLKLKLNISHLPVIIADIEKNNFSFTINKPDKIW